MWVGVLGPLQVHLNGQVLGIRPGHTQRVLCALVSRANEYVSVAELIDAQWPDDPPVSAQQNTRRAIHWLRRAIGDPRTISYGPAGYRLRLDPGELDELEFSTLLERAQREQGDGRWREAADLYSQALRLWRGKPYAGLEDCAFLRPEVQRLTELRTLAWEGNATVGLALGKHADLIPDLAGLVESDAVQERLVALYMRALHAGGRPAEAQAAFWRAKRRLSEELGADPTPELQELYDSIVRGTLPLPQKETTGANVPAQLPTDVRGFVGRRTELDQLQAAAALSTDGPAAVIATISGTAGVGKTALAVHWAHRAAQRFPDGQLYVNLRGFDSTGSVTAPADAVRGFLDALGVAPAQVPIDLDSQAALYRTLLAGKWILVVLDNARDTEHVRSLLPGSSGCLALVTSRNDLTGLVVKEGASPIGLGLLSDAEASQLLHHRLSSERVAVEPEAFEEIVTAGAGLPLALAILAARAVTRPQVPLRELADGLRGTRQSLGAFSGADDPGADVRTVFSWSYDQLTPGAARLFRHLGLHPGPDISTAAVASLAGLPSEDAQPLLAELTRANLITQHVAGRYACHDLLRVYAGELSQSQDPDDERRATRHRMLDHYLHTAFTAERQLFPARTPIVLDSPTALSALEPVGDLDQAMSWFAAERVVLLGMIEQAFSFGFDTHAWQLPWTLDTFFYRRGHWRDRVAAWRTGVEATRRLGDRTIQARVLRIFAYALTELNQLDEARDQLQQVLDLDAGLDDRTGQAHTHWALGRLLNRQGSDREALDHCQRALALYRAANEAHGEANMLNALGWLHAQLGDYEQARTYCEEALTLQLALGNTSEAAATWDSLGYAHRHLGAHQQAIACYESALALYRDLGNRPREADTLTHLGDLSHLIRDVDAARRAWRQAVAILEDLGLPEAEAVRAKLADC